MGNTVSYESYHSPRVKKILESLPFVSWDRYVEDGMNLHIYGWIERDQDEYKDFVYVEYDGATCKPLFFLTSSDKYSKTISDTLFGEETEGYRHNPCRRVEDFAEASNVIHLEK